jgi:hypothetical protein
MNTLENTVFSGSQFRGKSKILEIIRGIEINKTFRAAIKLELFTLLEPKPLTLVEIKERLELHGRGLNDFLDLFVSLGILHRDANGIDARYSNTEETSLFLVKGRPYYVGWWFEDKMQVIEQSWGEMYHALKTGKPQRTDLKDTGDSLFNVNYDSNQTALVFISGMNLAHFGSFRSFVESFDFSSYTSMCDIGGGNGLLAIMAAEHHRHLKCFSFDLPVIEHFAKEKIEECGDSDRVSAISGDFFKDDFPKVDVITMGNILHDWSPEEKKILVKKAYDALPEDGALVILESVIDNDRKSNTPGLLMSLHMLLLTEEGCDFTESEFEKLVKEVGFRKIEILRLDSDSSAAVAYK